MSNRIKSFFIKFYELTEKLLLRRIRRLFLHDKTFSIISNNCWGGNIYQYFGLPYKSPFAGLFIFPKDYLKLLGNLKYYMNLKPSYIDPKETVHKKALVNNGTYGKYPIGLLDDIEIHFLHYNTIETAIEKWERRKNRINYDNLLVKFCDKDLATADDIIDFCKLDYKKKIVLTAKQYPYLCNVKLKNENGDYIVNEWKNFKKTVNIIKFINANNTL